MSNLGAPAERASKSRSLYKALRRNVVAMIKCIRRVNSHLTSIAYAIVRDSARSGKTPVDSPEIEVEEAWPAEESARVISPRLPHELRAAPRLPTAPALSW